METTGTVLFWHAEEGWGVIDSEETPGGCWAHFADVAVPGFRALAPSEAPSDAYHSGLTIRFDR